jgi:hypothetical protein
VDVVDRQARAVVGGESCPQHHLLQRRLAQLRDDGRGQRVAALGVQREEHRVVIAAAGQALLRVEQLLLVVVGAGGQAGDAARTVGVVARKAPQHERAELVGGPRLVGDAQARLAAVGIDLRAAHLDVAGGEALGREAAQRGGLGVVPGLLGEREARAQGPAGADRVALRLGGGVVGRILGNLAGIADLHIAHLGGLAGRDGDDDFARRLGALGRLVEFERQRGGEVAEGAEEFAGIGFGGDHEAGDFRRTEVVEFAVALDFQVQREVVAHRFRPANIDGEGVALVGFLLVLAVLAVLVGGRAVGIAAAHQARDGLAFGAFFFRQQAAALQKKDATKKQSRPPRRRRNGNRPDHGRILTARVAGS